MVYLNIVYLEKPNVENFRLFYKYFRELIQGKFW